MDCNNIKKLMDEMCYNKPKINNERNNLKDDTYCNKSINWYNEKCKKDEPKLKSISKS